MSFEIQCMPLISILYTTATIKTNRERERARTKRAVNLGASIECNIKAMRLGTVFLYGVVCEIAYKQYYRNPKIVWREFVVNEPHYFHNMFSCSRHWILFNREIRFNDIVFSEGKHWAEMVLCACVHVTRCLTLVKWKQMSTFIAHSFCNEHEKN